MAINQAHVHPHYTLPGVMHYLQTEFTKNERDRITWELERSEMKARIAELEGENRDLKHQLNQIQSKAVSPEGEKEEKHVPDSLLQSKLAVQENVKEIIYLLKGPNTVNQLESIK
ncbi:AKR_collapsed_G0041360.mRNA.1.CDS.1 [Saccharomyces cerevisiae]|nr:AKR_collapsed_G0041360.mRNA.1.CDS.1 [Saccharomyces cerevisiae]